MSTQQANETPASERSPSRPTKPMQRESVSPHLVSIRGEPRSADAETATRVEMAAVAGGGIPFNKPTAPELRRAPDLGAPLRRWPILSATLKRLLDVFGALLLVLVFAPLMVTIVALMSRDEGGILFKHRRVGRNGRSFECLKFRTMVPNADQAIRQMFESQPELKAEWISCRKLRNDPRVTPVGRFLRRTSLDELPQLWNVLRGDMSLVGPRPIVREELIRYGRSSQSYLSVKPGITGLWQVTGRNDIDYRRRVALDVYYVRKQTLLLDIYILFKTTRVVLACDGAY